MQSLPHTYLVGANARATGSVELTESGVPALQSAPPREFGGPGDQWSPESLLCASIASCFILTFRAVARASKLEWRDLQCRVEGTLERVEGVTRFTRFVTHATLTVAQDANLDLCRRLLEKAERSCLVVNSVTATCTLEARVVAEHEVGAEADRD